MSRSIIRFLVVAAIAASWPQSSLFAGVIRHDVSDSFYLDLANDPKYDSVGRITFKGTDGGNYAASGSLIASNWVLTAAHVVDSAASIQFHLGGTTYSAASWIYHPNWNGDLGRGYDIALIDLGTSLSTTPSTLYQGTNEQGKVGTFVGYGMTGTGLTGATSYDGQKRAGHNVIDVFFNTPGRGSRLFGADFDHPDGSTTTMGSSVALDLEYLISFGDSGGGVFIEENGSTFLAGVHSFGVDHNRNGLWGDYDDYTGHTRVSSHYNWIMDTIGAPSGGGGGGGGNGKGGGNGGGRPFVGGVSAFAAPEPGSFVLLVFGALGLLGCRWRGTES